MQDIHSIGGGGRLFTTGVGGGDRRLRPQHHHQNHQALKCPRCDSLNTKFCYYNNYNLSQPRHFCKSCRRYWTKGGVLRNVPVGGGCRKTKRSSKPKAAAAERERKGSTNSHSSSESSSTLTAATTTTTAITSNIDAVFDGTNNKNNTNNDNDDDSNNMNNNSSSNDPSSKHYEHICANNQNNNSACFEQPLIESGTADCGGIFSEIGGFTSLITSSTTTGNETMSFGFSSILGQQGLDEQSNQQWPHHQHHHQQQQQKMVSCMSDDGDEEFKGLITGGLLDQTVQVELSALQSRSTVNNGGFGPLDWHLGSGNGGGGGGGGDHGFFDLTNTVDQAYWSQTQWTTTDQDHSSLYLP